MGRACAKCGHKFESGVKCPKCGGVILLKFGQSSEKAEDVGESTRNQKIESTE